MTPKTSWISIIAPAPKQLKIKVARAPEHYTKLSVSQAILREHIRQAPGASQKSIAKALNWGVPKVEFVHASIKDEFYSGLVLISEVRIG